ncbi:MAG TPA: hypothetical protein VN193_15920 [Candidatus Angelobacter sp.]|jgi:hypothetical protein|nr:hypothetical protein [Candidatus Angelobacter sp.]
MAGSRAVAMKAPLALLLLGALAGCGVAAHAAGATVPAAGATSPARTGLFHAHLQMSAPIHGSVCGDPPPGAPPPTLAGELQAVRPDDAFHRAAAVATVVSAGPGIWNSPDGHRWTQAEIDAGTAVDPGVFTPYVLRIRRLLQGTRSLTVDQTITGYVAGGSTPFGDSIFVCSDGLVATPPPQPGSTVVVVFGSNFDTPSQAGPLRHPAITVLLPAPSGLG